MTKCVSPKYMRISEFYKNRLKTKKLVFLLSIIIAGFFTLGFLKDTKSSLVFAQSEKTDSPDAIAIRVIPNPDHLSISRWYSEQGFKGSPQALTVDGYEALRDGRTVYVNAANVVGNELYTNIYLISYNQEAEAATQSILNQIISHWKFNTNVIGSGQCGQTETSCLTDADCPQSQYCNSSKARITRDVKRLTRLVEIKIAMENYKETKGYYPKLAAGTYLANKTISTWPSWQQTLAKELGVGLPTDPINKLGDCPDYNSTTCWKEADKSFADPTPADSEFNLPAGSNAFVYTTTSDGSSYNACAIMESGLITSLSEGACAGSAVSTVQYGETVANQPPTITCGNLIGSPGKPFKGYISASDPNGDRLTWSIDTAGAAWLNTTLGDTANPNQKEVSGTAGSEGTYSFSVTVDDNRGGQATKSCSIIISSSALPVVTPLADKEIVIGKTLDFMIYATDSGGNYPLTFTISPSLSCTVESDRNCQVNQTIGDSFPATSPEGTNYSISIRAVNSSGVSSPSQSFNLKVINHKPVITKPLSCSGAARINNLYNCAISATDPDGHSITYVFSGLPAGITGNASTGVISGTPTTAGSYTIKVKAKDQYNAESSEESFILSVNTYCGDGVWQEANGEGVIEKCDGSSNIATTPANSSVNKQYGCDSECQFTSGWCGDGIAQADKEDCDKSDLAGKTCQTLGYARGDLSCENNCSFNTSQCINVFSISGNVKDYMTASPLTEATVEARDPNGVVVKSAFTGADGNYLLADVPALVNYNIIVSKTGYGNGDSGTFTLDGDKEFNFNLSGAGLQGAARFQLTWGASPKDLDSHLKFNGIHIYYLNKNGGNASLDKDAVDKYGPENIRIQTLNAGQTYKYFIHDYTHRNNCGSASFNEAKIEVYNSGGVKVKGYTSTHTGNCYWYVFDMDDTGKITDKNIYTNNIKDIDPAL